MDYCNPISAFLGAASFYPPHKTSKPSQTQTSQHVLPSISSTSSNLIPHHPRETVLNAALLESARLSVSAPVIARQLLTQEQQTDPVILGLVSQVAIPALTKEPKYNNSDAETFFVTAA